MSAKQLVALGLGGLSLAVGGCAWWLKDAFRPNGTNAGAVLFVIGVLMSLGTVGYVLLRSLPPRALGGIALILAGLAVSFVTPLVGVAVMGVGLVLLLLGLLRP